MPLKDEANVNRREDNLPNGFKLDLAMKAEINETQAT